MQGGAGQGVHMPKLRTGTLSKEQKKTTRERNLTARRVVDNTTVNFEASKCFLPLIPQNSLPADNCIDRTRYIASVATKKHEMCL